MTERSRPRFRQLRNRVHQHRQAQPGAELAYLVPNQRWAVARSRHILKQLKQETATMNDDDRRAHVLRYLRATNPFVVEEVMLSAAEENHGWSVQRPDYIHDGGIDGMFWWDDEQWLCQTKRYNGPIDPEHVKAFVDVVRQHEEATAGLFATTGKVCLKARYYEQKSEGSVMILSGDKLITFLLYSLSDESPLP